MLSSVSVSLPLSLSLSLSLWIWREVVSTIQTFFDVKNDILLILNFN